MAPLGPPSIVPKSNQRRITPRSLHGPLLWSRWYWRSARHICYFLIVFRSNGTMSSVYIRTVSAIHDGYCNAERRPTSRRHFIARNSRLCDEISQQPARNRDVSTQTVCAVGLGDDRIQLAAEKGVSNTQRRSY